MMRTSLLFLFAVCCLFSWVKGQEEVKQEIRGASYLFRTVTVKNEDCCKDFIFLRIFREEKNGLKSLLTFPLFRSYADGHYEEVELGKYRVEGNELLLFTWWNFRGQDNAAPVGAKKMVYEVREDGKLYWKSGLVYLEEGSRGEGAGFLKYPVTNQEEREVFVSYVRAIEKKHLARFVFGTDSDALFAEVKQELKNEIAAVKANW